MRSFDSLCWRVGAVFRPDVVGLPVFVSKWTQIWSITCVMTRRKSRQLSLCWRMCWMCLAMNPCITWRSQPPSPSRPKPALPKNKIPETINGSTKQWSDALVYLSFCMVFGPKIHLFKCFCMYQKSKFGLSFPLKFKSKLKMNNNWYDIIKIARLTSYRPCISLMLSAWNGNIGNFSNLQNHCQTPLCPGQRVFSEWQFQILSSHACNIYTTVVY